MWRSLCGYLCGPKHEPLNDAFIEPLPKGEPLPKREASSEALRKHEVFNEALRGEKREALHFPCELQDYILLFLEGHERADLGIKTVTNPVKIPPAIQNIVHMIKLYEFRTMFRVDGTYTLFIEKVNAENLKGFISKMIRDNREIDGTLKGTLKVQRTVGEQSLIAPRVSAQKADISKGTLDIEYYWIKFCDY